MLNSTNYGIKVVYDFMITTFPFLKGCVGIYTTLTKEDKESQTYKKFILSTTKSAGTASDIQDLAVTIQLAEPFKSPVLAQQSLGRCRAYNTLYIDLVDHGFYQTIKYYNEKKPIFLKYALSCKDVNMSDEELEDRAFQVLNKYQQTPVAAMPIWRYPVG